MKSPTDLQINNLHVHTVYSVLDGASNIDQYIDWCKKNESKALGLTDHGWMIGLTELIEKCGKSGITPLPGCEFYVAPDKNFPFNGKPYDYFHLTVWAVNEKGYKNLIKLGSMSFNDDTIDQSIWDSDRKKIVLGKKNRVVKKFGQEKPRITLDEILIHNEGLCIASGCLIGVLAKCYLNKEYDGVFQNLNRLLEVFKDRFFLEILPHTCDHDFSRKEKKFVLNECTDITPDGDLQRTANLALIDMAKQTKLPLLMTIDSHFVDPKDKLVQDCLLSQGDPDGWKFFGSYNCMTTAQAWDFWSSKYGTDIGNQKIFQEAIENTHRVSDMAKDFKLSKKYYQPEIYIPEEIKSVPDKEKMKLLLLKKVEENGKMKWDNPAWIERLNYELSVVCDNGIYDFSAYFLFLEEWCQWAREHSIFVGIGRGSGSGSLLNYLLKITYLDPFRYGLPFERFLSQGRLNRGKFPDIDMDFSSRDLLIAKLFDFYGDKMAQLSTHGTLKIKSAIKDAARSLLGMNSSDPRIDKITKTIPMTPTGVKDVDFLLGYKDEDGHFHEGHLDKNDLLKSFFDSNPEVYSMVLKLLGVPRSVGRHASGFCIASEAISNVVPTCRVSDTVCTQYTGNWAEKAGLVKFDLLRVNTLQDISDCIRLVQKRFGYRVEEKTISFGGQDFTYFDGELPIDQVPIGGVVLDVYNLPEDPSVFQDFDEGKTETIFQMHTPLLTEHCKRLRPKTLKDLSALVALVRPGPLEAVIEDGQTTMTDAYIKRKNGEMEVTYIHPDLEPILKDDYGVFVYQETLMAAFSKIMDYSSEEADEIREMIGKKKKQQMEKVFPEIRKRLGARGWSEHQIETFIKACVAASSYSFNCFPYDQKIMTDRGMVKIGDIVSDLSGHSVCFLDEDGLLKHESPSHGQEMGERDVYSVEMEDGSLMETTEDHRFLCSDGEYYSLLEIYNEGRKIINVK